MILYWCIAVNSVLLTLVFIAAIIYYTVEWVKSL